jgi:2-polyprenyl-3-methyl-5-hydroxy-6-metoxy-1,4-benzoquinol methylase
MPEFLLRDSLDKIKPNHAARYFWAIEEIKKRGVTGKVLDAACGIGYGSRMLANAGFQVHCIDRSPLALEWHERYFKHPNVRFDLTTIEQASLDEHYDAVISIETIEHLKDDQDWIKRLSERTKLLIGTVPNERVIPFATAGNEWHFRHYTKEQFDDLMPGKKTWFTQYDKFDPVGAAMRLGDDGMTLGVVCEL